MYLIDQCDQVAFAQFSAVRPASASQLNNFNAVQEPKRREDVSIAANAAPSFGDVGIQLPIAAGTLTVGSDMEKCVPTST